MAGVARARLGGVPRRDDSRRLRGCRSGREGRRPRSQPHLRSSRSGSLGVTPRARRGRRPRKAPGHGSLSRPRPLLDARAMPSLHGGHAARDGRPDRVRHRGPFRRCLQWCDRHRPLAPERAGDRLAARRLAGTAVGRVAERVLAGAPDPCARGRDHRHVRGRGAARRREGARARRRATSARGCASASPRLPLDTSERLALLDVARCTDGAEERDRLP